MSPWIRHAKYGFTAIIAFLILAACTSSPPVVHTPTDPPPTPAPVILSPTVTLSPIATPEMPKDYTSEEFGYFLDLKNLCGSGEGEYAAWNLAAVWLEDREKFNFKIDTGVYGKHWDRTPQYYADKEKLILGFRHAVLEMERACLSL